MSHSPENIYRKYWRNWMNNLFKIFSIIACILSLISISISGDIFNLYSKSDPSELIILDYEDITLNSKSSVPELKVLELNPDKTIDLRSEISEIKEQNQYSTMKDTIFYSKSGLNEEDVMMDIEVDSYLSREGKAVILMYHRFRPVPSNAFEVFISEFEKQVDYLAKNDYDVITMAELVDILQSQNPESLNPKTAIITVDDGYRCFLEYAYPILEKYNFPATLFVYTDYINTGGQSLSWDELRYLSSEGIDIQAHSLSHPDLTNPQKYTRGRSDTFVKQQLALSKKIIERELGKEVSIFCWPYGAYNSHTMKLAILAGYEATVTIKPGAVTINSNEYELNRYGVYSNTPYEIFVKRMEAPPDLIVKAPGEDKMMKYTRTPSYNDYSREEFQQKIDDSYDAIFEVEVPEN